MSRTGKALADESRRRFLAAAAGATAFAACGGVRPPEERETSKMVSKGL